MTITAADWRIIRRLVGGAPYCALATLDPEGAPDVTPIGSLRLGEAGRGYYFEEYAATLAGRFRRDARVCVLVLNGNWWSLLWAMLRGRGGQPFGVRLHGRVGERREATPEERERFLRRVRAFRFTRGYRLVWGGKMKTMREISFDRFEPVRIPPLGPAWPVPRGEPAPAPAAGGSAFARASRSAPTRRPSTRRGASRTG